MKSLAYYPFVVALLLSSNLYAHEPVKDYNQISLEATATAEDTDPAVYIGQLRSGITIAMGALTRMFSSGDRIHQIPASIWQQLTDSGRISGIPVMLFSYASV